jgi:hypothetical protein
MPKVFISYSQEDNETARKLASDLKSAGTEIWIDHARIDGGDNLPERIGEACEWCDMLLLLWSANAAGSYWVKQEWSTGVSLEKRVIPCLLDDTQLPPILRPKRHCDFRQYETGYRDLCRTLKVKPGQKTDVEKKKKTGRKKELNKQKAKTRVKETENKIKPPEQKKVKQTIVAPPKNRVSLVFRSQPTVLSSEQVEAMLKKHGFFDRDWNKDGRGFNHKYETKTIKGNKIVFDYISDLMWQESGSMEYMTFDKSVKWIADLNDKGFAGFCNWRLPTLEEAMSLMEPEKKNGDLYLDPVFNKTQRWIWTSDRVQGESWAWIVSFVSGPCYSDHFDFSNYYVRAVRSIQSL